jgi:predicted enzyme related to lactoylglutathione lyase
VARASSFQNASTAWLDPLRRDCGALPFWKTSCREKKMSDPRPLGDFVWYDYMARDVDAARAFYTSLFDWQACDEVTIDDGRYLHLASGDVPFGGILATVPAQRTPPSWLGYVRVADVDATVEQAVSAGGTLLVPVREIPGTGRFAVLGDPCGAPLAIFQRADGADGKPWVSSPRVGDICWNEHWAHDVSDALAFYAPLFGWTATSVDMPSGVPYTVCRRDEVSVAGLLPSPMGGDVPPFWLYYVRVADADATVARALELGGVVTDGPRDVPNVGRFALLRDPQGAVFGIIASPQL